MADVSVRVIPPAREILPHREGEWIGSWSRRFFGSHSLTTQFTRVAAEGVRFRVLVYSGQDRVSHLRVIERTAHVDGKNVLVGGLGGVMTAPQHHGNGFSSMALREAERLIFDEMHAEIGFLLCLPELVPFYAKRRWRLIECPVVVDQPSGKVVWPERAMLLPKPEAQWTPETIDLGGLPF